MPKITKRTVDALGPAERERIVWDDDIKGFGVRVHPTGRKVYIVKYRHEGRSVKVTIGPPRTHNPGRCAGESRRDRHAREDRPRPVAGTYAPLKGEHHRG